VRRPLAHLHFLLLVAAVALVLVFAVGGAESAGSSVTWPWQKEVSAGPFTPLTSVHAPSGVVSLASASRGSEMSLVVLRGERVVQRVAASSFAQTSPLVAFVVADGKGDVTVFGVARRDVARLLLLSGADSRELSLNAAAAFSAAASAGTTLELQAYGADGSTIGVLVLPRTSPDCAMVPPRVCRPSAPALRVPHVSAFRAAPALQARVIAAGSTTRQSYTVSNRGRPVAGRAQQRIFGGHAYQLFLLGSVGGRAYYRIQLSPHYRCWGSGREDKLGSVGMVGCATVVGAYPLELDDNVTVATSGANAPRTVRVAGIVADQAASVALEQDGKTIATVPVKNNLFAFPTPPPRGFIRPVPLDANGKPLQPHPEWGEHQTPPADLFGPHGEKITRSKLVHVVQHGEAQGVSVAADQDGDVVFDTSAIAPAARHALDSSGRNAWFACFQVDGQNVRHVRSAGINTQLVDSVAFKTIGIKPRYDGCEAGGSYGHRWHDRYGPHTTIEIPFTPKGARYFEDRATARDLAAFVRSAKTQALRKKTGPALLAALNASYPGQLVVLASLHARAPAGQVAVWTNGSRSIFSERSHLDDGLYVQLDDGKITHENVRGLAFVF
jgi:hypothetical protein